MISIITLQSTSLYLETGVPEATGCSEVDSIMFLVETGTSNRPATNFQGISVEANRVDCLDEKSSLGIDPPRPE